jgi:hypothetical protein
VTEIPVGGFKTRLAFKLKNMESYMILFWQCKMNLALVIYYAHSSMNKSCSLSYKDLYCRIFSILLVVNKFACFKTDHVQIKKLIQIVNFKLFNKNSLLEFIKDKKRLIQIR